MSQQTKLKNDNKISYNEIFYFEEEINNIPLNINSPYQCFSLFFDEPFLAKILTNSNDYLNHKRKKSIMVIIQNLIKYQILIIIN